MPADPFTTGVPRPATIIGHRSPEFSVQAVVDGKISTISSLDLLGKYVLLFFYPNDFSFICPTEMHALQDSLHEFKKRRVEVIAASVDSIQTHMAWLTRPRERGGIEGITFSIVSDFKKELARAYCILDEQAGVCLRGVFLLDRDSIVQYGAVNNLNVGRNVGELLRVADAVQFTEKHGELCPMDWTPGTRTVSPTHEGKIRYYGPAASPAR